MKNTLFILVGLTLVVASCRTQKPPAITSTDSTSVTVTPRPVIIPAVQDSSSIKALFECDSNNRVILKSYNALWSQYMSVYSAVEPVENGGMEVTINTQTNHPATTVIAYDSTINRQQKIYLPGAPYPVEVEKPLSWLQKTLMYTGAAAWLILLLFIITRFYNPFK